MDPTERECDFIVDLESGNRANLEQVTSHPAAASAAAAGFVIFENGATLIGNISNIVRTEIDEENTSDLMDKSRNERCKTISSKKPPRPPKAFSLDAADHKLIRELTELAMVKRARIERLRAVKKMKVSKTSSSTGNLLAMIFTIVFCLVIIFQGVCPGRSSAARIQGSPESTEITNSRFISFQYRMNTIARDATNARFVGQGSGLQIGKESSRSSSQ